MQLPSSRFTAGDIALVKRLAAYIPVTLARQILEHGPAVPGQPHMRSAATLFADISGFTAMSEELAADGPRGAEELNRILLSVFTGMIEIIHGLGGAVSHFHGDAMAVYFPDEDGQATARALACGQRMQAYMSGGFGRVKTNRPPGKAPYFDLTIKIGLGYGACQEMVVGNWESGVEFILAGQAIEEAAAAEKVASSGQVVAGPRFSEKHDRSSQSTFAVIRDLAELPARALILDWSAYEMEELARLGSLIAAVISPALWERLIGSQLPTLAEHRPVTSVFVKFELVPTEERPSEQVLDDKDDLLQRYYLWASEIVSRFGGRSARLNRVLTGDKGNLLHIIFGAPVAPDAPDQAIRCALALQAEAPSFVAGQQIGLCVGKVFAGPVGAAERCEYTVVGDVVNMSARLAQICQPGQVLIDETTAIRVKNLIDCRPLPSVHLKGKQILVTPYQVKGELSKALRPDQSYLDGWSKPMVGRKQELEAITSILDKALSGTGGVIELTGSIGVGKTRLATAGVRYWLSQGGAAFSGDCQPHTSDQPFGAWRDVWHGFFGLVPQMGSHERTDIVLSKSQELAPEWSDRASLWGEVLDLPIYRSQSMALLSAEARQRRFFDLVRRCIQARAAEQPLLIVLEGLHWADQASLALIDDLIPHLDACAVALVLVHRPGFDLSAEEKGWDSSTKIEVADLPSGDARMLVSHWVGVSRLPEALEQSLGLRDRQGRDSPANPLFLEEALSVMLATGIIKVQKGETGLARPVVDEAKLDQMQLPDTIHGLLLARLDRLPAHSRDLLQIASVVGREFGLEPLDMITPSVPQRQIMEVMSQLADEQITRLLAGAPVWVYLFQHAMTHEVAYSSLPYARRQELHAHVAHWLSERYRENLRPHYAVLARHYSKAVDHESALHFALAAARDAQDIFANAEAVKLYKLAESHLQALGIDDHWQSAVQLYLARSEVYRFQGDYASAVEDAEMALELSEARGEKGLSQEARVLLADFRYRQSRFDEVQSITREVIDRSDKRTSRDTLARAYHWQGMAAAATRDFDAAGESLDKAIEMFTKTKNRKWEALALEAIAFVNYSEGDLELALEAMQRSVKLSRDYSTPVNLAFAIGNIGVIQFALGQAAEARGSYTQTIELARDTSRNTLAFALSNRAEAAAYLGLFPEARSDLEEAAALLVEMDDDFGLIGTYLTWGIEYCGALGEWTEAEKWLNLAQELMAKQPDSYLEQRARLLMGLGQVKLNVDDVPQAELLLGEAEGIVEKNQLAWWRPYICYLQGHASSAKGELEKAETRYLAGLEAVAKGGCPDYLPVLQLELARLEAADSKRLERLQWCVELTSQRSRYADKVHCLEEAIRILSTHSDGESKKLATHCKELLRSQRISIEGS